MVALGCRAAAQDYPSRTVTIIVPYPAGGPTDQLARVLAPKFAEKLGQTFIVENISGGGTTIATGRVARAAKDGHTLLLHNLQISANVALYPKLTFDTEKDLAPVAFINQNPLVLVGRKSLAANTLPELLATMKKTQLRMAHPGTGSTGHLATSLLAKEAKVEVVGVPYRGAAPALQDIAGGHVDLFFATPQSVVQTVANGQMKALWHHLEGDIAAVPERGEFRRCARAQARDLLLACPVRAGRNAERRSSTGSTPCCSA